MSASPADYTPGRTPQDGQHPKARRPKTADPLVRPKKRTQRPVATNGVTNQLPNGTGVRVPGYTQAMPQHSGRPGPPIARPIIGPPKISEHGVSGWSSNPVAPNCNEYPLVLSKRSLAEGFRHHVARFASKKNVDPRNSEEFVRPVRLHRRDPRAPLGGAGILKPEEDSQVPMDGMDDKEREKQEILKAEKEAKREAEMAQVAPSASLSSRTQGKNMKKTEQVYRNDQTEEQKKQSQLRYEEALPWYLEDFENKSTWVGSYEAALSDNYVMMVLGQDGKFRLLPLEKWYKFTQKNVFKTLTAEEAELRFNKKVKEPRWFMDSEESKQKRKQEQENKKLASGLFLGKWEKGGGGSGSAAPVVKHENADADDIDFQEDRFADDEDNMNLFEEDQETKETEERIKKDQLQANVFDIKEEKEYEQQEKLEKKEKEMAKKFGKRTKKALMKREKNYIYDSDTTDNPYSSESASDDTETELLKEEERKKAEESKASPEKDRAPKGRPSSGASSKGNNTPSHRPSKHSDPLRPSSSSNLKRPGSPLNSEASGNESARKKQKKKHPLATSSQPQSQTNNTLQPPSRPTSPPIPPSSSGPQPRKVSNIPSKRQRPRGGGSSSDTDGNAGSGGDMSDGARKRQKLKLNAPSKNGTPHVSRGASPEVPSTNVVKTAAGAGISRAGSPVSAPTTATSPTTDLPFPTPAELRAQVPPTGIKTNSLLSCFKGRLVGEERRDRFMDMMKRHTRFDPATKLLMLKKEGEGEKEKEKKGDEGEKVKGAAKVN
ncbi:transcription factor IIF subunit tfg1 [Lecanora helva]